MVSVLLSRVVILVFGLLYPAYASYKAVKSKNVKDYVKWMMYWIVFALFCAVETFTDVFLSWLPFYYEVKIIFVLWLLSPITKGSSFLYRKFVHPQLNKREKEIDDAIAQARTKGYSTLMTLGHKGLTYATNAVVTTAMKGQTTLVEHYKKSYSTNDLRITNEGGRDEMDSNIGYIDESDEEFDNRLMADNRELSKRDKDKNRRQLHRSKSDASETRTRKLKQSVSDLAPLDEDEHESSLPHDRDIDVIDTDPKDTFKQPYRYYPPRVRASLSSKEEEDKFYQKVKSDPYATLPRTRSRQRPKLHQY